MRTLLMVIALGVSPVAVFAGCEYPVVEEAVELVQQGGIIAPVENAEERVHELWITKNGYDPNDVYWVLRTLARGELPSIEEIGDPLTNGNIDDSVAFLATCGLIPEAVDRYLRDNNI